MFSLKRGAEHSIAFLFLMLIIIAPCTSIASWVFHLKSAGHLPKIIYFSTEFLILVWFVSSRFILDDWLIKYLIFYGMFITVYGVTQNTLSKAFFAHVLVFVLPVLGSSFGFYVAKYKLSIVDLSSRKLISAGFMLSVLITIYYSLHVMGFIPYFGVSSLIAIPLFYSLSHSKYKWALLFFVVSFLTGKRVTILSEVIVMIMYFLQLARVSMKHKLAFFCFIILLGCIWVNMENITLLRRFSVASSMDINRFSSGRLDDIKAGLSTLNELPEIFWFIGRGAGFTYVAGMQSGEPWIVHYSHFTPLAYTVLGGLLFSIPLYIRMCSHIFLCIRHIGNFYCQAFLLYFLSSFSGANFFSDPFVWIFFGISIYMNKYRPNLKIART